MLNNYSESHLAPQHGLNYTRTYQRGYYERQWRLIESDIITKLYVDLCFDMDNARYLDFACGTGRITRLIDGIKRHNLVLLGIDVSDSMLEIARAQGGAIRYVNSDLASLDVGGADFITAFRFFLNAEPALRRSILRGIYDSCSSGGYFISNIHVNSNSLLGLAYRFRNWIRRRVFANTCSKAHYLEAVQDSGFVVVDVIEYSYFPRVGSFTDLVPDKLFLFLDGVFKNLPLVGAQCFIVVARKII